MAAPLVQWLLLLPAYKVRAVWFVPGSGTQDSMKQMFFPADILFPTDIVFLNLFILLVQIEYAHITSRSHQ